MAPRAEGRACPRQDPHPHRDRSANGNPGDVAPVGEGISELRINYGPGYRVYYVQRGTRYILLLAGGDKNTQGKDIEAAKRLAAAHED